MCYLLTESNAEVISFLNTTTSKYQEEHRLSQILNGLDDCCGPQRSQLMMLTPLPTIESAFSMLQQEKSQREVFLSPRQDHDLTAMYSKNTGNSD